VPSSCRRPGSSAHHGLALGCLLLASHACSDSEPSQDSVLDSRIDSAGITIVTNSEATWTQAPVWRVGSTPRTVIGEGQFDEGQALLFAFSATVLVDGRIVVANVGTLELRVFDRDGHYLNAIAREGPGPGELRSLYGVKRLGRDSVIATGGGLAHIFDRNGVFVRRFQLHPPIPPGVTMQSPGLLGVFDTGELLVSQRPRIPTDPDFVGPYRDTVVINIQDSDGSPLREVGRSLGREKYRYREGRVGVGFTLDMPMPREVFVLASGRHIYRVSNEKYEIQVRSPSGKLQMLIRKEHHRRPVHRRDMSAYRDHQRQRMLLAAPERRQERFLDALVEALEDIEAPLEFPAIRDVRVDPEGCVWVHEYQPASGAPDWTVFDPDGVILGRARLPDELTRYEQVYEIGRDYVLGRVLGEDAVEFIHVYALERSN